MSETSSAESYARLYRLQDLVLAELAQAQAPFYLTGGTALSRFYLHHRHSSDLDLFTHEEIPFQEEVQRLSISLRKAEFSVEAERMGSDFCRFFLYKGSASPDRSLKIDFVHERGTPHFGEWLKPAHSLPIDSMRNILSNKITALTRQEAKDVADIWFICRYLDFSWREIVREADAKEAVEELLIEKVLRTFPESELEGILWLVNIDINQFALDREKMIEDIVCGRQNSLFKAK